MSRRSSKTDRPTVPALPVRAAELAGFEPTTAQLRAKVAFWRAWDEGRAAHLSVNQIGPSDVMKLVEAPSIPKWWPNSQFRAWFLNQDEWRTDAEASMQKWFRQADQKLDTGMMQDKDFIQLGKLLMELTGRISKVPPKEKEQPKLPPDQARAKFHELATSLGYVLPAPPEAPKPEDTQETAHGIDEAEAGPSGAPGAAVPD